MTAYEMRISDWSSDVCSSDLDSGGAQEGTGTGHVATVGDDVGAERWHLPIGPRHRACREDAATTSTESNRVTGGAQRRSAQGAGRLPAEAPRGTPPCRPRPAADRSPPGSRPSPGGGRGTH